MTISNERQGGQLRLRNVFVNHRLTPRSVESPTTGKSMKIVITMISILHYIRSHITISLRVFLSTEKEGRSQRTNDTIRPDIIHMSSYLLMYFKGSQFVMFFVYGFAVVSDRRKGRPTLLRRFSLSRSFHVYRLNLLFFWELDLIRARPLNGRK